VVDVGDLIYLVFLVFIGLIAIPISRSRKRKREERARQRRTYASYTQTPQVYSAYQQKAAIDFDSIIRSLRISDTTRIDRALNGIQLQIPKDNPYSLFTEIKIILHRTSAIKVYATLSRIIPSDLEVRNKQKVFSSSVNEIRVPQLDNVYNISTEKGEMWVNILSINKSIDHMLSLQNELEYFYLREDYFESVVYSESGVISVLNFIKFLHFNIKNLFVDVKDYDVEQLKCYNCEDPFDPLEEICDKCGAPRPRCLICFQDLKPSEKQEVVQLPCCSIYSHKDHMLSWLKKNKKCPNCHEDIGHWANKLML
jgi:hypothetical protein